jgi:MSHA biogenesis protein MshP
MITAIFLLVVVAILGAYIASLATTQQTSETLDVQGARAYQAAHAGMQWGVFQALRNGACAGSTSIALAGGLAGFAVTVQCTATPYTEASSAHNIYRIVSTGCSPPSAGACPGIQGGYYVERQLEATLDQ